MESFQAIRDFLQAVRALIRRRAAARVGLSSCAIRAGGVAVCWGDNRSGQVGDGTTNDATSPRVVAGLGTVAEISAGSLYACARLTNGEVRCWGDNALGQLGDGTNTDSPTPVVAPLP